MPLSYSRKRSAALPHVVKGPDLPAREAVEAGIDRKRLIALQDRLEGRIVLPSFPDYHADSQLSNPLFQSDPQLIVYCRSESDVAQTVIAAREMELGIRMRSGGHSTAGYSVGPGIVIDTSSMQHCRVEDPGVPGAAVARVGPGCAFGMLNDTLDLYNLHVPGGGCPDVCPAGYMQGGGYGFTSRIFGMNCDNVAAVRMVTAEGTVVQADDLSNHELFWAVRGGTGNNFGILTEISYSLHRIDAKNTGQPLMFGFAIRWPLDTAAGRARAAEALTLMQAEYMAGQGNPRVGYMAVGCNQADHPDLSDSRPYLLLRGIAVPPLDKPDADILKPFLATGGELQYALWDTYNRLNYRLLAEPADIPQFPAGTPMPFEDKHARYVEKKLETSDWMKLLELIAEGAPGGDQYCLVIEPYGGRIGAIGEKANAFMHRAPGMDIVMDGFWWNDDQRPAVEDFLAKFVALIEPFWNSHIYQNYPHRDLPDYRWNYWGNSFPSLLTVKQAWDMEGVFMFPQAITPYPEDRSGLTIATEPSIFDKGRS